MAINTKKYQITVLKWSKRSITLDTEETTNKYQITVLKCVCNKFTKNNLK